MLEGTQVAALRAGAGVIRFGLRQRGEVGAGDNLLSNVLRLGQRFLSVRSFSFGFKGTDDPLKRIRIWLPFASSNSPCARRNKNARSSSVK